MDEDQNNNQEVQHVEEEKIDDAVLREKLTQCMADKEEYLAGWQRCKADAINNKQREEEMQKNVVQFAVEDLIRSLLPILNTFDHALRGKTPDDPYVQGFSHIQTQLRNVLHAYGLRVISGIGEMYDITRHEPMETVPVHSEDDDNKIMEVVENGYILHDKVIKPAKVKVGEYQK